MLETALLFSANAGCFPKFYFYNSLSRLLSKALHYQNFWLFSETLKHSQDYHKFQNCILHHLTMSVSISRMSSHLWRKILWTSLLLYKRDPSHFFLRDHLMKLGQMGTGSSRAGMSSIITQAISMGNRGWASWTHPGAGESTAPPGLPGALVFLEAGLAEDNFKPFLSTWSASLDS